MNSADTSTHTGWFCLRARSRREHTAAAALRQRVGIEVFAPRIKMRVTHSWAGLVWREEPLFPGYVFARFSYPLQLRQVITTSGIHGVVQFGEVTPPVADGVIAFLRAQVRLADTSSPLLEQGAWVRIVGGCFRANEGRVLSIDSGTDRARVLLSLLGRDIQVSVPAHQLAPASTGSPVYPPGLQAT